MRSNYLCFLKEELHSDESNTIEAAAASEVSSQYGLSPGPSLPETNQSAFVAINLNQSSSQFATSQSGFVPLIFKPAETGMLKIFVLFIQGWGSTVEVSLQQSEKFSDQGWIEPG